MKTFRVEYMKPVRHVATQCTIVLAARSKADAAKRFSAIQPDESYVTRITELLGEKRNESDFN